MKNGLAQESASCIGTRMDCVLLGCITLTTLTRLYSKWMTICNTGIACFEIHSVTGMLGLFCQKIGTKLLSLVFCVSPAIVAASLRL